MQGARSPRRGGGVGAEGSCVHPAPFCTATLFSCRSYTITPALRSDAVARSYAREREHTQTCPPPPQPTPHLLLARPLARAPALPLPNGPLCSCASITPRVRGSHICAHTCSLPAGAPLGIPKFCLRMPGLPRMAGAILLPPTHPHPKSCHPPLASTGTLPAPRPLARSAPSGLHAHAAAYGSAAYQLLGRRRKKKPHRFS